MKYRLLKPICFLLIVFFANTAFVAGVSSFTGNWSNEEAPISDLQITMQGDEVFVQVWENTEEGKQDWGRVRAERYDRVGQDNQLPTLTATYELNNRQVLIVLSSNGYKIEAKLVSFSHASLETEHAVYHYEKVGKTKSVVVEKTKDAEVSTNTHSGQILGKALGMAKSTASVFHLSLYGPDNPNQVQGTQTFSREKTYEFSNLPDGTYWLIVDSKAMTGIEAFPAYQEIVIKDGKSYVLDVELN
ncbi:MAG: hypothetical protein AAF927_06740 [Bacteroidota bacterium]